MTEVLCDASVVVKWFDDEDEPQLREARRIAEEIGDTITVSILDLTHLEVGNALLRGKLAPAARVLGVLQRLRLITGPSMRLGPSELADALSLASARNLTLYDASYWAMARALGAPLVTTDSALLAAGGGETPAAFCKRLGLEVASG